jgi:inosine-uridine nucleoside N-ribohydrolase
MPTPLILDTDIGIDVDDALALCFAALDPRIELRAVTTVNGDTRKRAHVARALLGLCGREDVVVGAGASSPIDGHPHATMPLDYVDAHEVQGLVAEAHSTAHEVLAAALEATSPRSPVTICTIGPVTNVASFLNARPDLLDRVARVQMMGGCLAPWQVEGVPGPEAEFNVGCDPVAVSMLFALPVPIGLVPLDVTATAWLSDEDVAAIGAAGRLGAVLGVLMQNFLTLVGQMFADRTPRVRLHDPLAVAALVEPRLARFEAAHVSVVGKPGDCRTVASAHGRPIDACRAVDAHALAALVVRTLTARAGVTTG